MTTGKNEFSEKETIMDTTKEWCAIMDAVNKISNTFSTSTLPKEENKQNATFIMNYLRTELKVYLTRPKLEV